jgi:TP901 family phage tail tape measure protein
MAGTDNRRVTIFVNGKEVEFSLKGIGAEMAKTRNELRKLTIGTQEYNETASRLKNLQGIYQQHTNQLRQTSEQQGFFSKSLKEAKTTLGDFVSPAALVAGAVAGIGFALNDGIGIMRETNKALKDLQAITGVSAQDLDFFRDTANQFAKEFGAAPAAILEAFKLAGSARPELLESKESMAEFTREAMLLAKASGIELPEAISQLTTIMNANGASTEETARYINVLAAGSKFGAKEVDFLAKAMEKIGPVAATAGLSIEQQTAALELLGEKGFNSAETAGTAYRNILLILQQDERNLTNGKLDMNKAFENYSGVVGNSAELMKIFGKENVSAAQALLLNKERVDQLTDAVTGTNTAQEQAATQMSTLDESLNRLSSRWSTLWSSMGEGENVLTRIVDGLTWVVDNAEQTLRVLKGVATFGLSELNDGVFSMFEGANVNTATSALKASSEVTLKAANDRIKAQAVELQNAGKLDAYIKKQTDALSKMNKDSAQYKALNNEIVQLKLVANAVTEKNIKSEQELLANERERETVAKNAEKSARAAAKAKEDAVRASQERSVAGDRAEGISPIAPRGFEGELQLTTDLELQKQQIILDTAASTNELLAAMDQANFDVEVQKAIEKEQAIADARMSVASSLTGAAETIANQRLNKRVQRERQALEEQKKQGLISEAEYDKKIDQIERAAFQRKKRMDIAAAIINGALTATKASAMLGGPVNPAWGPAMFAIAAQTAAQVGVIAAQEYGEGGMVFGPSHDRGGVPAVMEGGEYVIRKREVTAETMPILEAINNGKLRFMNTAAAVNNTRMDNGNIQSSRSSEMVSSMAASNQAMFDKIDQWQREIKVINSLRDQEDAIDRRKRVQNLANVA